MSNSSRNAKKIFPKICTPTLWDLPGETKIGKYEIGKNAKMIFEICKNAKMKFESWQKRIKVKTN